NPRKVLFPQRGYTKLDLARYYLAVADGALRGAGGRPTVLVRYPDGIGGEFFYEERAPRALPPWIEVVALIFPYGRGAEEVVPRDEGTLAWMANLACLELHPHPVRADDLDHPDELRVDLDPVPGVAWPQIREVARVVRATLDDFSLVGWPKSSGSRGMHVYVRIERRWTFDEMRRAALERLLELSARQERDGLGDAPWPPNYKKQPGEPARVQPSRRRTPTSLRQGDGGPPKLQRRRKHPLIEIGRAQKKDEALAGLERW